MFILRWLLLDNLTLCDRDTVAKIFEPVVTDILRLIREQVQSVQLKRKSVKVCSSLVNLT